MNQAPTSSQIKCHFEPEGRSNLSFVSVRLLRRYALRNDIDLLIHCNDKVGLMNQAPTVYEKGDCPLLFLTVI